MLPGLVFAGGVILVIGELARPEFTGEWVRLLFLSLAMLSVCSGWARRVPAQNIAVVTLVLVLSGIVCGCFLSLAGNDRVGKSALNSITIVNLGLLWCAAVLSSRGVALNWLWPRIYRCPKRGLWVLATTMVLTCLVLTMWTGRWPIPREWLRWLTISAVALGSVLLCTPWLIPKRHAFGDPQLGGEPAEESTWGMASVWGALVLVALAGLCGPPG